MFDKVSTNTEQGNIGEATAIAEYTKLGYAVSIPLTDSNKYDLIIDNGKVLQRVQVKTTNTKTSSGVWDVFLATSGGNTKEHTRRKRQIDDYDILFILTGDGRCWSIPVEALGKASTCLKVGRAFHEYELNKGEVWYKVTRIKWVPGKTKSNGGIEMHHMVSTPKDIDKLRFNHIADAKFEMLRNVAFKVQDYEVQTLNPNAQIYPNNKFVEGLGLVDRETKIPKEIWLIETTDM